MEEEGVIENDIDTQIFVDLTIAVTMQSTGQV